MHDARMMATPIPLARRRVRQGVLRNGRDSRQVVGVTRGEGSESHAQVARDRTKGTSARATIVETGFLQVDWTSEI